MGLAEPRPFSQGDLDSDPSVTFWLLHRGKDASPLGLTQVFLWLTQLISWVERLLGSHMYDRPARELTVVGSLKMPMLPCTRVGAPGSGSLPCPSPPQNCMNLPPDKVQLLSQYDNEKKWELICDQVGTRPFCSQGALPGQVWSGRRGDTAMLPRGPRPCSEASVASGKGTGGICRTLESPSLVHRPPQGPHESQAGLGLHSEELQGLDKGTGQCTWGLVIILLLGSLEQLLSTLHLWAGEERG